MPFEVGQIRGVLHFIGGRGEGWKTFHLAWALFLQNCTIRHLLHRNYLLYTPVIYPEEGHLSMGAEFSIGVAYMFINFAGANLT